MLKRSLARLAHDLFYTPDLPGLQTDLDAVWMVGRFGKDVFDNTFGQPACALVLFQHDQHSQAGFNIGAGLSIYGVHIQILMIQVFTSWLFPFCFKLQDSMPSVFSLAAFLVASLMINWPGAASEVRRAEGNIAYSTTWTFRQKFEDGSERLVLKPGCVQTRWHVTCGQIGVPCVSDL